MSIRSKPVSSGVLVLLLCAGLAGQDQFPSANTELANKALGSLSDAYNARKGDDLARLFTSTGEFIDGEANVFQGREAIAAEFSALFQSKSRHAIAFTTEDVREISPGLLSIDARAKYAHAEEPSDVEVEFAALLAKQADGRWLFASVRSHGEDEDDTPHGHLKLLEWLIGEWVDESNESTMHMNSRWSEDKNFILTDFEIRATGRKVMSGTQRIGWDGSLEKFKSWVFDSDGGHAEGIWTEREDYWVVKAAGVRSDGRTASATQIYEPRGADSYWFSVIDRRIGEDEQPEFRSHVVRKPPEPEKTSESRNTR